MSQVRFSVYGSWKELPEAVLDAGLGGIANAKAARKRVLEARRREAAAAEAEAAAAAAAAPRDDFDAGVGDAAAGDVAAGAAKRPLEAGADEAPPSKAQALAAPPEDPRMKSAVQLQDDPRLAAWGGGA